jgi:ribosome-associated heat shock protein Hsp15
MKGSKEIAVSERVDRWMWQVRIFKTRSKAALACDKGKVIVLDIPVKSSYKIKIDQILQIKFKTYTRTVKVLGYPGRRVGAKLLENFMVDLTPEEEYRKKRRIETEIFAYRDPGMGRPTKKERRQMNKFRNKS